MIIYRPHRGGLAESMAEALEFENIGDMEAYIVKMYGTIEGRKPFNETDIVLTECPLDDPRTGWRDTRRVCINRYFNFDFAAHYGKAQCIGFFATDYGSLEQPQRMCKEFLEGRS